MLSGGAHGALAQDGGSAVSPLEEDGAAGFYLEWVKILLPGMIFLFWVGSTDWLSRDAQAVEMDYLRWNPMWWALFFFAQWCSGSFRSSGSVSRS